MSSESYGFPRAGVEEKSAHASSTLLSNDFAARAGGDAEVLEESQASVGTSGGRA